MKRREIDHVTFLFESKDNGNEIMIKNGMN